MGTTLTGTTPQDTYDSLIKVTDNGPLSGSLKVLTDGLGNDSALALSTGAARVTGSLGIGTAPEAGFNLDILTALGSYPRISGSDQANVRLRFSNGGAGGRNYELIGGLAGANNSNFSIFDATASATRLTIDSTGNVGIGTSSPTFKLSVNGGYIQNTDGTRSVLFGSDGTGALAGTNTNHYFRFITNDAERLRITEDGYVRLSSGSGGIQFNSDTAAANALDDYEEGTWTMGVAFGGGTTGITYGRRGGTYTKIGRQVTVCGDLILSAKGSSTGSATITGLPFTINGSSTDFLQAASFRFAEMSFVGLVQGYGGVASTIINMEQVTSGAGATPITHADFEDATQLMVSLTYFV